MQESRGTGTCRSWESRPSADIRGTQCGARSPLPGFRVRATVGKGPETFLPSKPAALVALGAGCLGLGAGDLLRGRRGARGRGCRREEVARTGSGRAQQRAGLKALGRRAREALAKRADFFAGGVLLQQVLLGPGWDVLGTLGQRVACPACHEGKGGLPAPRPRQGLWGAAPTRRVQSSAARGA